ncbi:predicted protein [Sclerotinia sclerotiorum 1980 UF-70]|uniref:Uncharacterized protein n=1 Tax=Sclerotinia sclerotiorum (strain ATCC 18683 / 1980 / Ss-1) TaxID=665079 RepID=A7F512_SCLS1|nr:predicted protein [Sclerotinia sclerotiorum 1980 UF-70]EDN97833.1 predicted protein [Sclerotinia sclerotiorum 1980 UF-70]
MDVLRVDTYLMLLVMGTMIFEPLGSVGSCHMLVRSPGLRYFLTWKKSDWSGTYDDFGSKDTILLNGTLMELENDVNPVK